LVVRLSFVGKTGLDAFSDHVPDHGAALLFFGRHVGITDAGQVGRVIRPE
jgi:Limiting CO2-inducible proteins B/C beta carbonyic anhydrases